MGWCDSPAYASTPAELRGHLGASRGDADLSVSAAL